MCRLYKEQAEEYLVNCEPCFEWKNQFVLWQMTIEEQMGSKQSYHYLNSKTSILCVGLNKTLNVLPASRWLTTVHCKIIIKKVVDKEKRPLPARTNACLGRMVVGSIESTLTPSRFSSRTENHFWAQSTILGCKVQPFDSKCANIWTQANINSKVSPTLWLNSKFVCIHCEPPESVWPWKTVV